MRRLALRLVAGLAVSVLTAASAGAQTAPAGAEPVHVHGTSTADAWQWRVETNIFAGYNRQARKFTDFDAWESQNWLMATAARTTGAWTTTVIAGGTLEPFTLADLGSPQVFQTGETFGDAPLIDYQHPHDLAMHLGADTARAVGRARLTVGAALVGGPPIGPQPFMHRVSAIENPQVPLSHHQLDATHITHGVVRARLEAGGVGLEAATFRGQEPDEQRTDLDLGRLDSQAVRVGYLRGAWDAQVSIAWLTRPERLSTYDAERRTASLAYTRTRGARTFAATVAAGQNREAHGNLEAYLAEAMFRPSPAWAAYTRVEWLDKDILDAGFHPVGVGHTHRQSRVGALTIGGVKDVASGPFGRLGLGADVTTYRVPANLRESYGRPFSMHVFVRYYGRFGSGAAHRH